MPKLEWRFSNWQEKWWCYSPKAENRRQSLSDFISKDSPRPRFV